MLDDARGLVSKIQQHESTAKDSASRVIEAEKTLNSYVSGKKEGDVEQAKTITAEAVATVQQDPNADPARGLRAAAIKASEAGEAKKAANLWIVLADLQPEDFLAHFNAGYWIQKVAEESSMTERTDWLRKAGMKYAAALRINPDLPEAANNWGLALAEEAQAVVKNDLGVARRLWRQAGEQFVKALMINSDQHEAAFN